MGKLKKKFKKNYNINKLKIIVFKKYQFFCLKKLINKLYYLINNMFKKLFKKCKINYKYKKMI